MPKKSQESKGLTVKKSENFSEWYSQVLEKAELVDLRLDIKGFVVIRPWGALTLENMFKVYESELQIKGHKPTIFPSVIPEYNLKREASHIKGFTPEVFWLQTQAQQGKDVNEERLALRPTSEALFSPMFSLWIRSWRDLPLRLYQRGSVFRLDTKATRPLIRGREFWWIEAHCAFSTKEEAEKQVQQDINTTEAVMHKKFGIPFLALKRPGWDKFAGAEYTIGSDVLMPDGKIIQQPSTHMMGQHFSKAFNATFKDEKEQSQWLWTTAYGPAISRIFASVISLHGNDKGLVLPFCISPLKAVIVPIYDAKNRARVLKYCREIKSILDRLQIASEIDLSEKRPGEKFYEWELKGVPFRLEFGESEVKAKKATLFTRDTGKKERISISSLKRLNELGKKYDDRLRKKADAFMKGKIVACNSKEQIAEALSQGKIAKVNWCSIEAQGESCAEHIEKEFSASVRGTLANKKEKSNGKCVICNKQAKEVVYIAKSY